MGRFVKNKYASFIYHIKHSVVSYLLITYLLVLLIPIICNCMIYVKSMNTTKEHAESIVKQINKEMTQNINALQVECYNVYQTLFNNPTVQKIAFSKEINETTRYLAREVKNDLASLVQQRSVNSVVFDDIQLYFNNGFCISPDRGEEINGFLVAEGNKYFSGQEQIADVMKNVNNGAFVKNNSGFSYVNTIRFLGVDHTVTMLIHISRAAYYSNYNNTNIDGLTILLLNKDNDLIFTNNSSLEDKNEYVLEDKEKIKIDKNTYFRYEKDLNGIKLICLLPQKNIERDIVNLKIMIFIQLLLAVMFGGVAIRYIMKQNRKSIDEIMLLIDDGDGAGNEIEIIKNSLQSSRENVNRLNSRIEFLEFLAINDVIMNIVYGLNINEELMRKVNVEFPYKNYYVAIIDVADRGVFTQDGVFSNGKDPLYVAVSNIIDEKFDNVGKTYTGVVLNEIILIINSLCDEDDIILAKMKEIHCLMEKHLNVFSRIALSEKTETIVELSSYYYQAINSVEHLRLCESLDVVLSTKRNRKTDLKYEKEKTTFVNGVISGDKITSFKVVENILLNGVNENSNISVIKYVLIDIIMTVITELNKKNAVIVGQMMENNREIFEEILNTQKISVVKKKIYEFIGKLCDISQEVCDCTGIEEKVSQYIKENFTNVNLSVKTIASKFDITYAYLSNRFKTKFGVSITDYLEELRITKAKQLMLEHPEKTIDDISSECGYCSKLTFSRQFKKHNDMTPGRFKELNQ